MGVTTVTIPLFYKWLLVLAMIIGRVEIVAIFKAIKGANIIDVLKRFGAVLRDILQLHEFKARYLLSSSDCETVLVTELLKMADTECLELWNNLKLNYTESKGHPLLRKEIS
jgi:hypothetical protein